MKQSIRKSFSSFIVLVHIISGIMSCNVNGSETRSSLVVKEKMELPQEKYSNKVNTDNTTAVRSSMKDCDSGYLYVFIMDPDKSGTNIRSSPNGKSVLKLYQRDEADIHFVVVTRAEKGWFKIHAIYGSNEEAEIKIPGREGWIHGSLIFADTKPKTDGKLKLLSSPAKDGRPVYEFNEEFNRVKLTDMCGSWIKVEFEGISGWIESEWLCGYYFTTCS